MCGSNSVSPWPRSLAPKPAPEACTRSSPCLVCEESSSLHPCQRHLLLPTRTTTCRCHPHYHLRSTGGCQLDPSCTASTPRRRGRLRLQVEEPLVHRWVRDQPELPGRERRGGARASGLAGLGHSHRHADRLGRRVGGQAREHAGEPRSPPPQVSEALSSGVTDIRLTPGSLQLNGVDFYAECGFYPVEGARSTLKVPPPRAMPRCPCLAARSA